MTASLFRAMSARAKGRSQYCIIRLRCGSISTIPLNANPASAMTDFNHVHIQIWRTVKNVGIMMSWNAVSKGKAAGCWVGMDGQDLEQG